MHRFGDAGGGVGPMGRIRSPQKTGGNHVHDKSLSFCFNIIDDCDILFVRCFVYWNF